MSKRLVDMITEVVQGSYAEHPPNRCDRTVTGFNKSAGKAVRQASDAGAASVPSEITEALARLHAAQQSVRKMKATQKAVNTEAQRRLDPVIASTKAYLQAFDPENCAQPVPRKVTLPNGRTATRREYMHVRRVRDNSKTFPKACRERAVHDAVAAWLVAHGMPPDDTEAAIGRDAFREKVLRALDAGVATDVADDVAARMHVDAESRLRYREELKVGKRHKSTQVMM